MSRYNVVPELSPEDDEVFCSLHDSTFYGSPKPRHRPECHVTQTLPDILLDQIRSYVEQLLSKKWSRFIEQAAADTKEDIPWDWLFDLEKMAEQKLKDRPSFQELEKDAKTRATTIVPVLITSVLSKIISIYSGVGARNCILPLSYAVDDCMNKLQKYQQFILLQKEISWTETLKLFCHRTYFRAPKPSAQVSPGYFNGFLLGQIDHSLEQLKSHQKADEERRRLDEHNEIRQRDEEVRKKLQLQEEEAEKRCEEQRELWRPIEVAREGVENCFKKGLWKLGFEGLEHLRNMCSGYGGLRLEDYERLIKPAEKKVSDFYSRCLWDMGKEGDEIIKQLKEDKSALLKR